MEPVPSQLRGPAFRRFARAKADALLAELDPAELEAVVASLVDLLLSAADRQAADAPADQGRTSSRRGTGVA